MEVELTLEPHLSSVWDLESGEMLMTLKGHASKVNAVIPTGGCG